MKLIWSDLITSSISNDERKYFVTFLDDFIKRSKFYVFRIKVEVLETFKNFKMQNEHDDARIYHLRIDYKDEYFNQDMSNYTMKHDIKWELIVSNTSK
jgi:hypothetical protein